MKKDIRKTPKSEKRLFKAKVLVKTIACVLAFIFFFGQIITGPLATIADEEYAVEQTTADEGNLTEPSADAVNEQLAAAEAMYEDVPEETIVGGDHAGGFFRNTGRSHATCGNCQRHRFFKCRNNSTVW